MTAQPGKNPYRPGAATPPLHLAGREPQLARFPKLLAGAPEIPANMRLTGLRGVGKSVLLKEFETIARNEGWAVVRHQVEPRHNSEEAISLLLGQSIEHAKTRMSRYRRLRSQLLEAVEVGRRLLTVSYEDINFSMGGAGEVERDLSRNLYDAVETALDTGHEGFALLLDEAQVIRDDTTRDGEYPLSMLVAAVNALQEAGLPLALVMCGLPTLRANLQRARTYSERMFRGEVIGELTGNPGAARDAFVEPLTTTSVTADDGLIARVLDEVEGYPFFIQLWGAELWEAARDAGVDRFTTSLLDSIETDIYARLDEEFYAGRVDTLTPSEQDLLMSTGRCAYPPLRSVDIRGRSDKSEGNVNVLMGRLTEQGVLYRIQKGVYEYTAPKFHQYLERRLAALD
ncbi:AAA ATPase domain-containing protein [Modestobacter sp. DSM 44400]|uniref:ATP-binding protein n=1 Tax=Modestobacter sp. DSM 44400 TaxID=1550230 RepID=UPI000899048B|nr:ATP-binding protein [Modestobacter sp. DSM 44400]SDY27348.1 AAA ATPase domain-containing protein [Modestobacter sp. DSM 44400]